MPANHIHHLQCVLCGTRYNQAEIAYTCPTCGPLGVLEVHYDYGQVAQHLSRTRLAEERDPTMWRYRALLPVSYSRRNAPPLAIGGTPLYPVARLRAYLGMQDLWLKDDTRNPSASLKDRASVIAVVLSQGKTVACASTGNAASSLVVQAAAVGLPCYIFVPHNAPRAKVVQLLMCGATVFAVQGSYDDAFDLCIEACSTFGWYNRNTGYNPYLVEGKKTAGLEFAEPSGAACYAGLLRLLEEGSIARDERVVLLVTGSGLKSIDAVAEAAGSVVPIAKGSEGMKVVRRVVQQ